MKLTETLRTFKNRCLTKLQDSDVRSKPFLSFIVVTSMAAGIWLFGPGIEWEGFSPLISSNRRLYIIVTLYLLWLLKYLLIDLDAPSAFDYKDPTTRKTILTLQKKFYGALKFLRKTKIARQGKSVKLDQLPWFLLIGPKQAGKTTLLAKSNVNFILQRQFQQQHVDDIAASDHCDWWVTRDASIIDIPSRYFNPTANSSKTPALWDFYLRMVKDQRGQEAFNGIVLALPLPEIMHQSTNQAYESMLKTIFKRLREFQKEFPDNIPCYILVTKCDLLPGFAEFFAEAGTDESTQAWGILLPQASDHNKLKNSFVMRFNALIKKLNQQLIWRLHQERNPMARPYIKDFPLQVERLKEYLTDFIKQFNDEDFNINIKGVHLTSSLQEKPEEDSHIIDEPANTTQKSVQLFKEPAADSRAFFIKQFISQALSNQAGPGSSKSGPGIWKRRLAYAASFFVICVVSFVLGKDFNIGIQHTRIVQSDFKHYELSIKHFDNPAVQLKQTVGLMNQLRDAADETRLKFNLESLMSFYSLKSKQKSFGIYKKALHDVYLVELKNYFGEFLKTPINKNTYAVYAVLKAYLMLGDASRMDKDYLKDTLRSILPNSYARKDLNEAFYHIDMALAPAQKPLTLDATLIESTRRYLLSLQGVPLAYIILKNINNNYETSPVNLGLSDKTTFASKHISNKLPSMFTVQGFTNAFSQDTEIAASEALTGNWVLGDNITISRTREEVNKLTDKLRTAYIKDYTSEWEKVLTDIHLGQTNNLQQTDNVILQLISDNSPLLQLLQTLHENTYFEPISTSSEKLQKLGLLVDNSNAPQNLLYQILVGLQSLHQYIQPAIVTNNQRKQAFDIVSNRMAVKGTADAITQVRLIAQKSPEPIKSWLTQITDDTWRYLMSDATKYINVSWQESVGAAYKNNIANRYPFSTQQDSEVPLDKFIQFFGKSGTVVSFYDAMLKPFIDTSSAEWKAKEVDHRKLPLSAETLLQIRQGLKIHQAFFPNDDNQPSVQFTIQPYKLGRNVRTVKLNVNDQEILRNNVKSRAPVILSWPITGKNKSTSLQFAIAGNKPVDQNFAGDWGWFKLMSKSFDSAVSSKQALLNFSHSSTPVKYTVNTGDKFNPFMAMNLNHFRLPSELLKA